MRYVIIVPNEETSWGVAVRYNIVACDTKEVLSYNVNKDDLEGEIKKQCYVLEGGAEYLPSESALAQEQREKKELAELELLECASRAVKHPFSRPSTKVILSIALVYIWMYGIGMIVHGFLPLAADIGVCIVLSVLTILFIIAWCVDYKAKQILREQSRKS